MPASILQVFILFYTADFKKEMLPGNRKAGMKTRDIAKTLIPASCSSLHAASLFRHPFGFEQLCGHGPRGATKPHADLSGLSIHCEFQVILFRRGFIFQNGSPVDKSAATVKHSLDFKDR
jgi:hypothetical protein